MEKGKESNLSRKRNVKRLFVLTALVIFIVFMVALIRHKSNISSVILSDYYFMVGIAILALSVLTKLASWTIYKRHILKSKGEDENNVHKARMVLKLITKILYFIGFVSIIISLFFLFIYYNM